MSAYADSAELISEVLDTGSATVNYGKIVIDADSVKGTTTCGVQIRTAETEEGLQSEDFVGPHGKRGAYFTGTRGKWMPRRHDGERFIQYKVTLGTSDPVHSTPVLRSITIRYAE